MLAEAGRACLIYAEFSVLSRQRFFCLFCRNYPDSWQTHISSSEWNLVENWDQFYIRESKSLSDCKCFEYDSSESLQNIQKIDSRLFHGDLIFAITFTYKIKTLRRNYIRCCLLFQSFLSAKTLIKKLHVNTIFENFVRLEKQTNTVCPI